MNALGCSNAKLPDLCVFVHSIILLYGRRIGTSASASDWSTSPQPVTVWSQSPAHHWRDTCLGRGGGATRLCPGKMALEEQCSAPPRWRSISLTHIEFPEGKCARLVPRNCRGAVTLGPSSNGRRACVCGLLNGHRRWSHRQIVRRREKPERSGESNPGCQIVRWRRMRSWRRCPQWRLAYSTLAGCFNFDFAAFPRNSATMLCTLGMIARV